MSDFCCPNCHEDIDSPDDCYDTDTIYDHTCPHCEYVFVYTVEHTITYNIDLAPCLNGEKHMYSARIGFPEYRYMGRYRCDCCNKEYINVEEAVAGVTEYIKQLSPDDEWARPYVQKYLEDLKK